MTDHKTWLTLSVFDILLSYLSNKLDIFADGHSNSSRPTFPLISVLGFKAANFLAAFSMDLAAPSSSFSAMKVGSEGSTQSSSFNCSAAVACIINFPLADCILLYLS